MAAYFTHYDLQPVHLILTLQTALNLFNKVPITDSEFSFLSYFVPCIALVEEFQDRSSIC